MIVVNRVLTEWPIKEYGTRRQSRIDVARRQVPDLAATALGETDVVAVAGATYFTRWRPDRDSNPGLKLRKLR